MLHAFFYCHENKIRFAELRYSIIISAIFSNLHCPQFTPRFSEYGRFHYGFLLLCGVIFLCVGCQNGINAYILPSAECDLKLSSEQKGLLNVSFLVGKANFSKLLTPTYNKNSKTLAFAVQTVPRLPGALFSITFAKSE